MRRFLLKTFLSLSAVSLACLIYGFFIEPKQLKIRKHEFVSDKYQGPDLRIGMIVDIHMGGMHVPTERVSKLVERMNDLEPDIVLIPGDFIDGVPPRGDRSEEFNRGIREGLSALSGLKAPSYATLGNHDGDYDASFVQKQLEAANIPVLNNNALRLSYFCLVGLEDEFTGTPNRAAFDPCGLDLPPLVMMHSPDSYYALRPNSILALAGHTHGGQINLPIFGRRINSTGLGPEHSYGFTKLGGVDFYVSSGVGTSKIPARFRSPPEIVVITLKSRTRLD